jgi:predicted transposase YbfD/YdcC
MDHITLEAEDGQTRIINIGRLWHLLRQITDKREARGKRYPLSFILLLIILAKLSGEHKPKGIADWIKARRAEIVSAFKRERKTVPALNTIRRTLDHAMSLEELERFLLEYIRQEHGGGQTVLVTIDGKTLRGTIDQENKMGLHLLAAYLPEEGVTLMQLEVEKLKENEHVVAVSLLANLDLKGRVVCGDAMFTQRKLSVQILAQGGDYIWFAKGNQPTLREEIEMFFQTPQSNPGWHKEPLPQDVYQQVEKAHGRLEKRTLTLIADEEAFLNWPGARQVFRLERQFINCATGDTHRAIFFGVTSLPPERVSAQQLFTWTRQQWAIENGLHYRRDKTMEEDGTRFTSKPMAQAIATLNNFVIGLANKLGFQNLAAAHRILDARITSQLAKTP